LLNVCAAKTHQRTHKVGSKLTQTDDGHKTKSPSTYSEVRWIHSPRHVYTLTALNVDVFNINDLIRLLHSNYRPHELFHKYSNNNNNKCPSHENSHLVAVVTSPSGSAHIARHMREKCDREEEFHQIHVVPK